MKSNKVRQQNFHKFANPDTPSSDELGKVMSNYDSLVRKIQRMIIIKTIIIHLKRAEIHRRENNSLAEKKSLLAVLHKMKTKPLSNMDLANAITQDNLTGSALIKKIEKRLNKLGWDSNETVAGYE